MLEEILLLKDQQQQIIAFNSQETLFKIFNEENHPHNRCRLKPCHKIRQQFEQAIRKRSSDGLHLTYLQFKQYYLDTNACIPLQKQQYFIDILINGFNLLNKQITIDRLKQMEVTIFQKVRQKTYIKKDQGTKSKNQFRFFDMEDKGVVDYQRFVQTLQRLGCKFINRQLRALYAKHAGSDGILTYQEMCALLFQMGSGVKENPNFVYQQAKGANNYSVTHGMSKRLN